MQNKLKDNICKICRDIRGDTEVDTENGVNIADDATMNEIRFCDLKNWFQNELRGSIKDIVKQEMTTQLAGLKKEISDVKKVSNEAKETATSNVTKVMNLEKELKAMKDAQKEESAISKNNLKYLINFDRNERRQNVIMFGVPEDEIMINEVVCKSDREKCLALLDIMELREMCRNTVKEIFRLGKKDDEDSEKRRPVKIKFTSSTSATAVINAGAKLKELPNLNIYVKPDKTKGEQEAFKRLGKRKEELLREYENNEERVKLKKGVLYVDDIEVDRYKSPQTLF